MTARTRATSDALDWNGPEQSDALRGGDVRDRGLASMGMPGFSGFAAEIKC